MTAPLSRRAAAEALGTALLVAAVVGSGIMGERLAGGNVAVALLANTIATGAALIAIILAVGPVSGAHLNPAVTLVDAWQRGIRWGDVPAYVGSQVVGGVLGVVAANAMFDEPLVAASDRVRAGASQILGEVIATFGLVVVIWGVSRRRAALVPVAVGAYITAAYWFTSSTSFANPAVTFARSLTRTFTGIRPVDVPAFVLAQLVGAFVGTALMAWLTPRANEEDR